MAGDNMSQLREPIPGKKLRVFYMEGINRSAIIQPLEPEMRMALRKVINVFIELSNNH